MQQRREEGAPEAEPLASPVTEGHEPRNCCHNSNFRKRVLETANATASHYLKQLIPGSEREIMLLRNSGPPYHQFRDQSAGN